MTKAPVLLHSSVLSTTRSPEAAMAGSQRVPTEWSIPAKKFAKFFAKLRAESAPKTTSDSFVLH